MSPGAERMTAGNLPAELTSLVDRRTEIAEAKALLTTTRLLTLTGMGGIGKSRLARRIAADLRRAFKDGVWLIELADLTEPALLVQTVAASLGLVHERHQWTAHELGRHLADRAMLLILDNCEHMVDACAVATDAILRAAPRLRILATSRQPLSITGEQLLVVTPLSVPDPTRDLSPGDLVAADAARLFVDRGRAVLPGFTIDAENTLAVASLCRRLEGIPLAIELAALQLRRQSLQQIVARLDNGYLLAKGSRSAPWRQQTLDALIAWSYELCNPEEQRLWRSLSVFVGGFEIDAVDQVCVRTGPDGHELLDLVASLIEKSVLQREPDSSVDRYRMAELIRAYGANQLSDRNEDGAARQRHLEWCTELAIRARDEFAGPAQTGWFARIRREQANIRAALAFALDQPGGTVPVVDIVDALLFYWVALGIVGDARHWMRRAIDRLSETDQSRARAFRLEAFLASFQGDQTALALAFAESQRSTDDDVDDGERAWITYISAMVATMQDDTLAARALLEEAIDQSHGLKEPQHQVAALITLVALVLVSPAPAEAGERLTTYLQTAWPREERWGRALATWVLGWAAVRTGHHERAAELLLDGMTQREAFNDYLNDGFTLEVLAWVMAERGQAVHAAELLGAARSTLAEIGSSPGAWWFLGEQHGRCAADLQQALGVAEFQVAMRRGEELGRDVVSGPSQKSRRQSSQSGNDTRAAKILTPRERQIAKLVANGLSNKQIADRLVISQRTAEGHVERILVKLGLSSRTQVSAWVHDDSVQGEENSGAS